jgi:large subunit ribosomal protein L3
MTQIYDEAGRSVPVTVLAMGPCQVLGVKTGAKHGYAALQMAYGPGRKNRSKALKGVYAKAGLEPKAVIREFRLASDEEASKYSVGQELTVAGVFEGVKKVAVTAASKGKGFQGVVKRHHFRGGDASHGSTAHRKPGSIGSNTYPARVFPGHRMAGRMGGGRSTQGGLKVVGIEAESHLMLVQGSVPGPLRCLVRVTEEKRS